MAILVDAKDWNLPLEKLQKIFSDKFVYPCF